MQSAEKPEHDRDADRTSRGPISIAILAALAFVPLVVAAGFLTDRSEALAVPPDISVLALRGAMDGEPAGRPALPSRAGY